MGNPFSRGGYVTLKGHAQVAAVRFLPSGELITAGDTSMRLWNPDTGRAEKVWKFSNAVETCCCSPDGRYLACGVVDGLVFVFDARTRQQVAHWQAHANCGQGPLLQFFADSTYLLSAAVCTCKIWSSRTTKLINTWDTTLMTSLNMSLDCTLLAVGSTTGTVTIHNLPDGNARRRIHAHRAQVWGVVFSPDSSLLATVSRDEADGVKLWSTESWELAQALRGHVGAVLDCAFSATGSQLITCGLDRTLRLWGCQKDGQIGNGSSFGSSAYIPGHINGIEGSQYPSIGWRCENVITGHIDPVICCAFWTPAAVGPSDNGKSGQGIISSVIASGARDGTARAWRLSDVPQAMLCNSVGFGSDGIGYGDAMGYSRGVI